LSEPRANAKRLTARNVGIALGIICIILGMSLSWTIDIYNGMNASLNSQVTNLQNQVNDLNDVSKLNKTEIWVNNQTVSLAPDMYSYWNGPFYPRYAGYIVVAYWPSTATDTYARVIYEAYGLLINSTHTMSLHYDNQISFGNHTVGWVYALFPVLPLSSNYNFEIRVGNNDTVGTAIGTVTITYYY